MIELSDFAIFIAAGAALTFLLGAYTPTQSRLRQWLMQASYAIICAGCLFYLAEHEGLTNFLDAAWRDYVIVGVLGFIGAGIVVLTFDLFVNFETLKDDPQYAMMGRTGLAIGLMPIAIIAMTAVSIAWYQIDPAIFEARSNIVYWRAAGVDAPLSIADIFLFALDQTQKALLFDISEVYRIGLIDIGNNPLHLSFSTACLIYRTYLSVVVLAIAIRLLR